MLPPGSFFGGLDVVKTDRDVATIVQSSTFRRMQYLGRKPTIALCLGLRRYTAEPICAIPSVRSAPQRP